MSETMTTDTRECVGVQESGVVAPGQPAERQEYTRWLLPDGRVSPEVWRIAQWDDRKGRATLTLDGTTKTVLVLRRRLLPVTADRTATVVEAGDRFRALCPVCGAPTPITPEMEEVVCPDHGSFPLHWLGAKPMPEQQVAETETEARARKPKQSKPSKTTPKQPKQPKEDRAAKVVVELPIVDLGALAANGELWSMPVAFDHPNVTVLAHALLVADPEGVTRKFCFNTYNGRLGRKAKPLTPERLSGADGDFAGSFLVKDQPKERSKLQKQGYTLYGVDATAPPAAEESAAESTDEPSEATGSEDTAGLQEVAAVATANDNVAEREQEAEEVLGDEAGE